MAPPREVTGGLRWELETVSASGYWDKALIVVPPVRAEKLQRPVAAVLARARAALAVHGPRPRGGPARAGAGASGTPRWTVIGADRRTEWSYGAALKQALADLRAAGSRAAAAGTPTARSLLSLGRRPTGARRAAHAAGRGAHRAAGRGRGGHGLLVRPQERSRGPPVGRGHADALAELVLAVRPRHGGRLLADLCITLARQPGLARSGGRPAPRGAPLIQPVIAAYFQGINSRDYAEYAASESAGQTAPTAEEFQTGFRSTQDSGMLITSIAVAPDGRQAADVIFTSRQQPQDGPDGESCTNWHLTMFFDDHAGTYTIGAPSADYHGATRRARKPASGGRGAGRRRGPFGTRSWAERGARVPWSAGGRRWGRRGTCR